MLSFLIAYLFWVSNLYASCQKMVSGFVDRNCDGKVKIVFVGDSIVKGYGDERNKGGYAGRLNAKLKSRYLKIGRFGLAGENTKQIFSQIKRKMPKRANLYNLLIDADAIIIDAGRNDYWKKQKVNVSVNYLTRTVKYLKEFEDYQTPPFITVSTLIHVRKNKIFQLAFVKSLNTQILKKNFSGTILQHTFPQSVLGPDGLHPNAKGYNYIYRQLLKQLNGSLVNKMLEESD